MLSPARPPLTQHLRTFPSQGACALGPRPLTVQDSRLQGPAACLFLRGQNDQGKPHASQKDQQTQEDPGPLRSVCLNPLNQVQVKGPPGSPTPQGSLLCV